MTDITGNQYRRDDMNNFQRVEGRATRRHEANYMEEEIPSSDSDDYLPYQPAAQRRRVAPIPPSQRPSSIFDETSSSSSSDSSSNISIVDLFESDVDLFDSDSS